MTGEILFGNVGMLPPSLAIHLSKRCGKNDSSEFQGNNAFRLRITFICKVLKAWDALEQELGTNQNPKYFSSIKHNFKIKFLSKQPMHETH
jgi:hypothetical protein